MSDTIGILGLGLIGSAVAARLNAADYKIIGFDPAVLIDAGRFSGEYILKYESDENDFYKGKFKHSLVRWELFVCHPEFGPPN